MKAETEKIVYDESIRVIEGQEASLENLRTRAGTLISAAALVTAFLAPPALSKGTITLTLRAAQSTHIHFASYSWAATSAFVGVAVSALAILWPYGWTFGHNAHSLMDQHLDRKYPSDEAKIYRHLAYYNEVNHSENAKKLNRLFGIFALGCVLLVVEIGLWLTALVR